MSVCIITTNNKENATIIELANKTIPDQLDVGMSRTQFETLIADDIPIHGFVGCVEVAKYVLDDAVPAGFPERSYINENDEEAIKKWREYVSFFENDTHAVMIVGCRDTNGNRKDIVPYDELTVWIDHFGLANVFTSSETKHKIQADYSVE